MRLSAVFAPTLRDDPAEAEIASHRLLLRAAFVRQGVAGVFTILALGLPVVRKPWPDVLEVRTVTAPSPVLESDAAARASPRKRSAKAGSSL